MYKETLKLIWNDIYHLGIGLFIGALGFFILPLALEIHRLNKWKKYKVATSLGEALSMASLLYVTLGLLNLVLIKATIMTHGLYFAYYLGKKARDYVSKKEEKAIELINKEKREGKNERI